MPTGQLSPVVYHQAPRILFWEVTRACALVCRHCRATAIDQRDPGELSTEEGRRLIDEVAAMGTTVLVLTGGDPLQRDDLEELVQHARTRGLIVGSIPATTPRLTHQRILALRDAGVHQLALSVDADTAAKHDAFRGVPGTFEKLIEAAGWIRKAGINLQANTVFGAWNADDFDAIAALVARLGVVFWEVFFLVPTGRATQLPCCSAQQMEHLFEKLCRLAQQVPFVIKVTEGHHLRRFVAERFDPNDPATAPVWTRLLLTKPAVNAGNGICFVDHVGEVYPSGFLPLACGNVRQRSLADIYRQHPVFRELRQFELLKGKCGVCEYRALCTGGSRARAYAVTGDYLAEEPCCAYQPRQPVATQATGACSGLS